MSLRESRLSSLGDKIELKAEEPKPSRSKRRQRAKVEKSKKVEAKKDKKAK